ncbi:MAG: nucleotidyltransferase family protein [Lachnospiraceae bacterium]|nr:nucleotidyltransferase family protein [Lachnospiraceae bacterium]
MKTAAIIAEYNPFHNGHAYQLEEVRKASGADFLIILMSGDFVQRGTPAIFDKYVRTQAALLCGADLVLELPLPFATGSAPRFAEGAVSILNGLGIVDELWFGSEEGSMERFAQLAGILVDEPEEYREYLKDSLRNGLSYPVARAKALGIFCKDPSIGEFLKAPNNILGLEYILALKKVGSSIKPRTLQRTGSGYHAEELEGSFSSATAIRSSIMEGGIQSIASSVPENCYYLYEETASKGLFVMPDQLSEALRYQLWKESKESLCRILDINEELANRIINLRGQFTGFEAFAELLQTRNQTKTGMQRALLHILLGITWEDAVWIEEQKLVRMLGLSEHAKKNRLLSAVSKEGPVVLTANLANHPLQEQYRKDLFASNYYESLRVHGTEEAFVPEYSRKLIF